MRAAAFAAILLVGLASSGCAESAAAHPGARASLAPVTRATPAASPTESPTPHPAPRILFVGDSLTGGWYATDAAHDYASLVTAYAHGVQVDTHGTYGVNVPATLAGLDAHPAPAADIVIVELGTNDTAQPGGETLSDFTASYGRMVGMLHAASPKARFICLGTWRNPNGEGWPPNPGAAYDRAIQAACPGVYVPLSGLYMQRALHGPAGRATWKGPADAFHPNDEGHSRIAAAVETALQT